MRVEVLVLGGQERGDDAFRDRRDRHEDPALGRVLGQQPAVPGIDAGRDRRLVIGQLLVIGQVAAEMPDRQPNRGGARDRQHDHAEEQEAKEFGHRATAQLAFA